MVFWMAVLWIINPSNAVSQHNGYYYMYPQDRFMKNHTENDTAYLKSIYKNLDASSLEPEDRIDGQINIILINHGKFDQEILPTNNSNPLSDIAVKAILEANKNQLKETDEKYMTEFIFFFDKEPFETNRNKDFITVVFKNGISCGPPINN